MPFPFEIDENLLPTLVNKLEEEKTKIADFTAGLLLTKQISMLKGKSLSNNDREKNMIDGIDFLLKLAASNCPDLMQKCINFILWHIRVVNQKIKIAKEEQPEFFMPLVEKHLALSSTVPVPNGVFKSYSTFGSSKRTPAIFTLVPVPVPVPEISLCLETQVVKYSPKSKY